MSDTWEESIEGINGGNLVEEIPNPITNTAALEDEFSKTNLNDSNEIEESAESIGGVVKNEIDDREHLNVVFIGHVDAGKSTLGGQILYQTGNVDERVIQKYEKEAKDRNRDSWYMAYIMDTNAEEREKGKTVEVGRAYFSTKKKRYTLLDAPGHKNFVPNMITGAAQADIGVMVIAARKGEFETGFERGGQTREHAQLAKTLGVTKLIIVVNKMDDPSIIKPDGKWNEERFKEIETRLIPFLKTCGYNPKKDLCFVPISALQGKNITKSIDTNDCPWWTKGCLFDILDEVEVVGRDPEGPFCMPVLEKYKDMGVNVMGKSESGTVKVGDQLLLLPNRHQIKVESLYCNDIEVLNAKPGENLRLKVSGIEDTDVSQGFVVSSIVRELPVVRQFEAQLMVLELLEHKAVFTAGYKAVLHIHSLIEECEIVKLIAEVNMKKNEKKKVTFVKSNSVVICRIGVEKGICVDEYSSIPQLGRFTLRDEGHTIAVGKIIKLPKKQ